MGKIIQGSLSNNKENAKVDFLFFIIMPLFAVMTISLIVSINHLGGSE